MVHFYIANFWSCSVCHLICAANCYFATLSIIYLPQGILNEDDEKLKELRNVWGSEIYNAVTKALKELKEHNPCGRHGLEELWNFSEGRKATLVEVVHYILTKSKAQRPPAPQTHGQSGRDSEGYHLIYFYYICCKF